MKSFSSLAAPLLLGELLEEGVLAPAEDLDALAGEVLVEPPQLEARPVDLRHGDLADEAGPPADAFQVEGVVLLQVELEQVEDPELLRFVMPCACPPTLSSGAGSCFLWCSWILDFSFSILARACRTGRRCP